jgi:hypothetical protein
MDLKNYLLMFRVKIALKITLGGLIAVLICNFFHLPSGFLSPVILLMVMSGFHGKIFEVGVQTLIGCVLSGIYSLFIVYYFLDSKPLYLLLSAVWIFFCITFIGKYFIASVLSAILTTMTMFVAVFGTVSETTASVHNFIVQLFIALTVSWFVDELLIPHRSEGLLYLTLSTVYKDYSIRFKSYVGAEGHGTRPQKFGSASVDVFNNLVNLVRRTEREARGEEFHAEPFLKLVAYAKSLYIKLDVLAGIMSEEHSCLEDKLVSDSLNDIFSSLAAGFEELADAIDENRAPDTSGSELDAKITNLKDLNAKMRLAEGKDQDYFEDLLSLGSILPLLEDTAALLRKAFDVWDIIYTRAYDKLVLERVTRSPGVESTKSVGIPYLTKDAVHQSLKTVTVIVLLLFGEFLFNLPGGYQASFYGVLFGSIPNTGQAHLRGKLGIIGVAAGLIYGIVGLYIVTLSPHFPVLLLIYTLGTIVSSYIASGGQKIAFSGLQAGLMLPYVFFTSMGPGMNLHLALMRFFALLMASSIGLLVLHNIWPVSPYRELKKKISSALRISGAIFDKLLILDEKEKIMAKDKIEALVHPLASAMPTSSSLLFDAQYIISDENLHSEEFVQIIESLEVIYAELETLKKTMYTEADNELIIKYFEHMTPDYRTIYDYFGKASQQFYTGDAVATLIEELSRQIQDHRQAFRETGFWKRFPMEEVEKAVLVAESVDAVLESLYKISVSIAFINQSEASSPAKLRTDLVK